MAPPSTWAEATADSAGAANEGDAPLFDAVLTPHRSLTPLGLAALGWSLAAVGFAAGAAYVLIGAWPVAGFTGAEFLLLYVMLRLNYRAARVDERVRLTPRELIVERYGRRGTLRWAFHPYWLRVHMADPPEPDSLVELSSHGRRLAIARSLSLPERIAFARALKAALETTRIGPASPTR
jgi:uncharacterized membrane protein